MSLIRFLDSAIQRHIYSGLRVGAVLSGGLDSSTVVRLAKKWDEIPTFTGWYDVPGYDERRWARMAAGTLRHHHEFQIVPDDFIDCFDEMLEAFEPPYQGVGMFGQYVVAKRITEATGVQVVLSGEGADELFGGYARLHQVAGHYLPDGYDGYQPPADYPNKLIDALDYDFERLPDLLAVDDQALGAFGLRAAAPFTDHRVVELALALPPHMRVGKHYLRATVRGLVPDPIIDRTDKMGFPAPLVLWAQGPLRDFIGDRLGYIPDVDKPYDRAWWYDMLAGGRDRTVA